MGERRLQRFQALVERVQRHAEERGGDHRFDDHVLLLQLHAGLAGEDEELAERVAAAEVQARVGLGEPGFLRRLDERRERGAFPVGAEDLVQGAGDDGLDGQDLVAAVRADGEGFQHRERRADRGFVAEETAVLAGRGLQCGVFDVGDGEGTPVGGDDVEACPEQVRVALVQGFAVGAVHEDGALGGQVDDRVHEVARDGAVQGGDASEVDAPAAAVAEAGDAQRLSGALRHRGGGPADHLDQRLPHGAETGDEQVHLP